MTYLSTLVYQIRALYNISGIKPERYLVYKIPTLPPAIGMPNTCAHFI